MHARLMVAVAVWALPGPAIAAALVGDPLAGLQAMRELNAIILGDAKGWLAVEGKTHIGGNLTNAGIFGEGDLLVGATPSQRATLTVGGNVSGGTVSLANGFNGLGQRVDNRASANIGGSVSGMHLIATGAEVNIGGNMNHITSSLGSSVTSGGSGGFFLTGFGFRKDQGSGFADPLRSAINSETARLDADLKALSLALSGQSQTVGNTINRTFGGLALSAVSDESGVSVFKLTENDLRSAWMALSVDSPTTTIVFDVTGDGSYNWLSSVGALMGGQFSSNIIWNFSDATTLDISEAVFGSVLAPYAKIGANSLITGSLVAGSVDANVSVNLGTYSGGDMFLTGAVPEPQTWAMLILGFGLIGVAARRRRRVQFRSIAS